MDTTNTTANLSRTWTSVAAIIVFLLSKIGINVTLDTILAVISTILIVIGIAKQAYDHFKLSKTATALAAQK